MIRMTLICIAALVLFTACGGEAPVKYGPKTWKDINFIVETRPSPLRPGMNEFLIVATNKDRSHAHLLIVSVRTSPADEWRQAIQDGHVGVYRKAAKVRDPAKDILYVQVKDKRDGSVGELAFALQ